MNRIFTGILLLLSGLTLHAQTTTITASHIALFGNGTNLVTGQFCVSPTDSTGIPISLTTPAGQQLSPLTPLCFPITNGALDASAVVPDVSQTQPVNACLNTTIYNNLHIQLQNYGCLQPQGATWSFDAFVPGTIASIPALTLPQFQVNGVTNPAQGVLNFVGSGVSYGAGGQVIITGGGGTGSYVTYLAAGLLAPGYGHVDSSMVTGGVDAFQAINTVASTLPTGSMVDAYSLGTGTFTVTNQLTALNQSNKALVLLLNPGTRFQINTVFSSPTNTPASCAIPLGGAQGTAGTGSAIVVPGYNAINANFYLGSSAVVQDVICNGDFTGNQENMLLDGVVVAGNQSATMNGALIHLAGVFVPTTIRNSGTLKCFGQCLELDAGTTGTGGPAIGNLSFINDNFQDGYSGSAAYPGSVVNIDTLALTSQTSNINFYGGMIELNGPHNALFTVNGRNSVQSDSIGLFGTTFQGASATPAATYTTTATASSGATSLTVASATNLKAGQMVTGTGIATGTFVSDSYTSGTTIPITIATTASLSSGSVVFSPNVDPIQLKDTSSFYVSNLRFRGANNTTWQQNLVDIAGAGTNRDFGINLDQVTAFSGQFNCLIRNVVEGTCETGFATGWGDNALPNYTFGQIMPILRQTNIPPPAATTGNLGTIWTNTTASAGAAQINKLVSGTPTWVALDVQNTPAVSHQWLSAYNSTTGAFTQAQPAAGDISGLGTAATATAPANTAAASHQFLTAYNSTTGAFSQAAPGAADTAGGGYAAASGSVNVLTATLSPVPSALVTGMEVNILPNLANTTTAPTLNLNSLGAVTITKNGTAALAAGDLSTTAIANLLYDGTRWQLLNPQTAATTLPTITAHTVLGNSTGSSQTAGQIALGAQEVSPGSYIALAGSVNVYTATLSPAATSYVNGLEIIAKPNLANTTTTPTLNVNSLGAKNITKNGAAALEAGDLSTTAIADFVYDGTEFQLTNPQSTRTTHLEGGSSTVTTTAGTGAGTGPTITLTNATDLSGYVQVLTGTSPAANATIVTINFATAYSVQPKCWTWPANGTTNALSGSAQAYTSPTGSLLITTSGMPIIAGSTALAATTTYLWGYACTQ